MKLSTILIAGAFVFFSSCAVYRSGQTPDDMYYSPGPPAEQGYAQSSTVNDGYVPANSSRDDGKYYNDNSNDYNSAYDSYATPDDRWLMMRVRDRARWSVFDDYSFYSPYNDFAYGYGGYGTPGLSLGLGFGYGGFYNPYPWGWGLGLGYSSFGYNPYFSSYWNWNALYNPYYPSTVVVVNPKVNPAGYNTLRNFNLNNYTNRNYNNTRSGQRPVYNGYVTPNNSINNSNGRRFSQGSNNSSVRDTYRPSSQDRPVRTYTPSYTPSSPSYNNSGSSGAPSSSGNSGGGSRPGRR